MGRSKLTNRYSYGFSNILLDKRHIQKKQKQKNKKIGRIEWNNAVVRFRLHITRLVWISRGQNDARVMLTQLIYIYICTSTYKAKAKP